MVDEWLFTGGSYNLSYSDVEQISLTDSSEYMSSIEYVNHSFRNVSKYLKVGHINARSIPKNIDEIRRLAVSVSFDILAVSETWLTNNVPNDRVLINGYNITRTDRNCNHKGRGGGVCFYVRSGITFKCIKVPSTTTQLEMLWIELTMSEKKIAVGVLYRPHWIPYNVFSELVDVIYYIQHKYHHNIFHYCRTM